MRKLGRKSTRKLIISLIMLTLLSIGVGYAYLTSNLSIAGITNLAGNTWDIHFNNVVITPGSVEATNPAEVDSNDNTKVNYGVTLNRPGDFYEFSVDIVNSGSISGLISMLDYSGLSENDAKVVDYSIKYDTSREVREGDIINSLDTKKIIVRVYYKEDILAADLPSTKIDLELSLDITFSQSDYNERSVGSEVLALINSEDTCMYHYEGNITENSSETVQANNIYYDRCEDKRNVIFGGYCWQIVRTTQTGGMKLLYNGDVVNDKCESTRSDHYGIVGSTGTTQTLDSPYLYGSSYTYDEDTGIFRLESVSTTEWNNNTYQDLISKYTCLSSSNRSCSEIYYINGYVSSSSAWVTTYQKGNTNYATIGTSPINANTSLAGVGYMFNKNYDVISNNFGTDEILFSSTFTYDNGTYTLSGSTKTVNDWENEYDEISNTHYTCLSNNNECQEIAFVFYTTSSSAYMIKLKDGKDVDDAIDEMIHNDNVNRYDSAIKSYIDRWYERNLTSYTEYLDDLVYCNDRTLHLNNGWKVDGYTTLDPTYYFKEGISIESLVCEYETDRYSVGNNKAKLTYPIGLLRNSEMYVLGASNDNLKYIGVPYWVSSPAYYSSNYATSRVISNDNYDRVYNANGVRPVISINSRAIITSGSGSMIDPYVIE